MGNNGSVCEILRSLHNIIFVNRYMFVTWDEMLCNLTCFRISNNELTFTSWHTIKPNDTIDFCNLRMVFRFTSFKQFSNTRKTTGNIFCLGQFSWCSGQIFPPFDFLFIFNWKVRPSRHWITCQYFFRFYIRNNNLRMKILFMFNDHHLHLIGSFILLLLHSNTWNHVTEFNFTCLLSDNGNIVRIPCSNLITFGNLCSIARVNVCSYYKRMRLQFHALFIYHCYSTTFI